jgi:hypothetical protein
VNLFTLMARWRKEHPPTGGGHDDHGHDHAGHKH